VDFGLCLVFKDYKIKQAKEQDFGSDSPNSDLEVYDKMLKSLPVYNFFDQKSS
jgi:hypothetical protein